ncbi:MAG: hypothetical protein ABID38_04205 [Candidatus Diapherotrites archaeon]
MESPKEVHINPQQLAGIFEGEKQKMEQLTQRFNAMQGVVNETKGAIDALKILSKAKKGLAVKIPLGGGALIDVTIDKLEKVQLNLPGSLLLDYTPENAIKEMEKRLASIEKNISLLEKEIQQTYKNLDNISKAVNRISAANK